MMPSRALFLQSEETDPFARYARQLRKHPLAWDDQDQLWVAYSYPLCEVLLRHPALEVPSGKPAPETGLSPLAQTVRAQLVRLTNPPGHHLVRQLTQSLFQAMQPVCIPGLMAHLLSPLEKEGQLDWVKEVAKKLPAMVILSGFGFSPADSTCVLTHLNNAKQLMLAHPGVRECKALHEALEIVMPILTSHCRDRSALKLLVHSFADADQGLLLLASNLLGLLIQSDDAGRGLLTNALIQALPYYPMGKRNPVDVSLLGRIVGETLRFDPPIHHTRRVIAQDIVINNRLLVKGQTVLLVLASANRDPGYFPNPHLFNPERISRHAILSFGAGMHTCPARQPAVEQTTQSLTCLFTRYPEVRLPPEPARYERLANARLRQELQIRFR